MLRRFLFLGLMISCILGITMAGPAQAAIVPNGDFELCNLTDWGWVYGNVGVDGPPLSVISGNCSAYLNTQGVGNVCSWLMNNGVHPTYWPQALKVKFKVRYSTNETFIYSAAKDDPFRAMLKFEEDSGDMVIFNITSTGVSAAPGFTVTDLTTGTALATPRAEPNFTAGVYFGWANTSDVYEVSGTIPFYSCAWVHIRFDICNGYDTLDSSFAYVDDVDFTFVNAPGTSGTWWKHPPSSPVLCP